MDSDNFVDVLVPILVDTLLFVFGLVVVVTLSEKFITCPNLGQQLEKQTKYSLVNGCFIKLSNGNWINSGKYSGVNLENK